MAGSDLLRPDPGVAIVIMGVSGCGKSTVAAMLADVLGCGFVEADDYHSHANKEKMSKGVPLTDEDRLPWLESLRGTIREQLGRGEDVTVSCSALRLKYREVLREGDLNYKAGSYGTCRVKFVCLEASAEVIASGWRRGQQNCRRGALHAGEPGSKPAGPAGDRRGRGDHSRRRHGARPRHRRSHRRPVQGRAGLGGVLRISVESS